MPPAACLLDKGELTCCGAHAAQLCRDWCRSWLEHAWPIPAGCVMSVKDSNSKAIHK